MIGIFGGTFDPVHFGHLRPAMEVFEALALTEMRFIPCGRPPHRGPAQVGGLQRLAMLRLAIAGQSGFRVDDRELRRDGPSYMVDTLASLKQETDQSLCLLLGLDAFVHLPSWHRWQDLFSLAHIVVMQRPGTTDEHLQQREQIAEVLQQRRVDSVAALSGEVAGHIYFQPVTALDISATQIRQAVQQGNSVRYLVPDAVYDYIKQRNFYA